MSYGFYRCGSTLDPIAARGRLAEAMRKEADKLTLFDVVKARDILDAAPVPAEGRVIMSEEPADDHLFEPGNSLPGGNGTWVEPPKMTRSSAKVQGYTGDECGHCHGLRMKMAGHCMVCEDCGTTTGCS